MTKQRCAHSDICDTFAQVRDEYGQYSDGKYSQMTLDQMQLNIHLMRECLSELEASMRGGYVPREERAKQ